MKCVNHPERLAEYTCEGCGQPFCSECIEIIDNEPFCKKCAQTIPRKGMETRVQPRVSQETEKKTIPKKTKTKKIGLIIISILLASAMVGYVIHSELSKKAFRKQIQEEYLADLMMMSGILYIQTLVPETMITYSQLSKDPLISIMLLPTIFKVLGPSIEILHNRAEILKPPSELKEAHSHFILALGYTVEAYEASGKLELRKAEELTEKAIKEMEIFSELFKKSGLSKEEASDISKFETKKLEKELEKRGYELKKKKSK